MHIPDGFLSTPVLATCAALAGAAVAGSVLRANRRMQEKHVPLFGVCGAFVFAAQMLNFPIPGGTSGHFVGSALVGMLLGPAAAVIVLTSVLVIQCLVFQDGGLTALGANVLNMGALGGLLGAGLEAVARRVSASKSDPERARVRRRRDLVVLGFLAGWLSVVLGAAACAFELLQSHVVLPTPSPQEHPALGYPSILDFLHITHPVMLTMVGVHALIGIGEGAITSAALGLLAAVRPDLLELERI